jgi:CRISPR-associated endoribonuclease Cas6
MRIRITFSLSGKRQVAPLNYQYPLSAWVYKTLARGDNDAAKLLHENGFKLPNQKAFKLFTFSGLQFPQRTWKILKGADRMELHSTQASLIIAFQIPEILNHFVAGLFNNQTAEIGDRISTVSMKVSRVEMLPEPKPGNNATVHLLSPVVVTHYGEQDKHEQYLKPGDAHYDELFFRNLTDKYTAWCIQTGNTPEETPMDRLKFSCLSAKPQSRLQTIKAFTPEETRVRGYLFSFSITAPPHLIKTGLHSGFGAMNALGFGCGEMANS